MEAAAVMWLISLSAEPTVALSGLDGSESRLMRCFDAGSEPV